MEGVCFVNGQWLPLAQATVPLADLAVVRGYGVFDYLRTYQGRPFHMFDHLLRFKRSAGILGLKLPYSFDEIESIIEQTLIKAGYPESGIKLVLTGGLSPDQITVEGPSTFCVMAFPHRPLPDQLFKEGIQVITTRSLRPLPQAKSTCYLPALAALQEARRLGADDAIYVNREGEVLEGLTSNIFVVKQGRLLTPYSEEVLPGITREIVKKCAFPDIIVEHASLPLSELGSWDEAFLTSSSREILPVIAIDGQPIGLGKVGPYTQEMMNRFKMYTQTLYWEPLCLLSHKFS